MQQKPRRIVVIGPEGSGKGTQAALLAGRLHLPAISSGDLLRAATRESSAVGREIARRMNKGKYLPTSLVNRLLIRWLRTKGRRGFLLDGYPRKLDQVKTLDQQAPIDLAFILDLPDQEAVVRIAGRRVSSCGRIYHTRFNPPPKSLRCGTCGDPVRQRPDDRPIQVHGRLRAYHRFTDPVVRTYDRRGLALHIDARPAISIIARQIVSAIDRFSRSR